MPKSTKARKLPFSTLLRAKLSLAAPDFLISGRWVDGSWFRRYLQTLHTVIRASVPLMNAARAESAGLQSPLGTALTGYYSTHAKEEARHDEWLLDDLEAIDVPRSRTLSLRPSQAVAELVGTQYYWISHWHPVCLLGYIAFLEGYPPTRSTLDGLASKTGLPGVAFRTLAKHSYLDPHHRDELDATIDSLPLTPKHEEWVTLNAIYSLGKWQEVVSAV